MACCIIFYARPLPLIVCGRGHTLSISIPRGSPWELGLGRRSGGTMISDDRSIVIGGGIIRHITQHALRVGWLAGWLAGRVTRVGTLSTCPSSDPSFEASSVNADNTAWAFRVHSNIAYARQSFLSPLLADSLTYLPTCYP